MKVEASAPSNIALIKYMGKTHTQNNWPTNASLSYTLDHLRSHVMIEESPDQDRWRPLPLWPNLQLSAAGQDKFLRHFARLKQEWGIRGAFTISSGNDFPSDCGLASSASSFAALTLATWKLAQAQGLPVSEDPLVLSRLSRLGSGSSCRSLFSPWALWRGEGAEPVDLKLHLEHAVVLVAAEKKTVSSSEAHVRVASSLLFSGRPERAEKRLAQLLTALQSNDWAQAYAITWAEFWDMHALFETSQPSFGYLHGESLTVLNHLRQIWLKEGDGPIVTMDAGANVHILLRPDQVAAAQNWLPSSWKVQRSWS